MKNIIMVLLLSTSCFAQTPEERRACFRVIEGGKMTAEELLLLRNVTYQERWGALYIHPKSNGGKLNRFAYHIEKKHQRRVWLLDGNAADPRWIGPNSYIIWEGKKMVELADKMDLKDLITLAELDIRNLEERK